MKGSKNVNIDCKKAQNLRKFMSTPNSSLFALPTALPSSFFFTQYDVKKVPSMSLIRSLSQIQHTQLQEIHRGRKRDRGREREGEREREREQYFFILVYSRYLVRVLSTHEPVFSVFKYHLNKSYIQITHVISVFILERLIITTKQ